jgi:hypothetical protein
VPGAVDRGVRGSFIFLTIRGSVEGIRN